MRIPGLELALERLPAPLPIWRACVDADAWQAAARAVAAADGRLVALWGADRGWQQGGGFAVSAAYALAEGLVWLDLALPADAPAYPDLSPHFHCARADATRRRRPARDRRDRRPRHAALARPRHLAGRSLSAPAPELPTPRAAAPRTAIDYPFVRVAGDGVHEIPVGPVHAGVIEPGHFRFSVVGEKVLRLEERLGYAHKGIEKRFTELAPLDAHRLAGRVSGDSTVAYAWAYCMALEAAAGFAIPARARWLRALLLERERVADAPRRPRRARQRRGAGVRAGPVLAIARGLAARLEGRSSAIA